MQQRSKSLLKGLPVGSTGPPSFLRLPFKHRGKLAHKDRAAPVKRRFEIGAASGEFCIVRLLPRFAIHCLYFEAASQNDREGGLLITLQETAREVLEPIDLKL